MMDPAQLLLRLKSKGVECVIVGGVAARIHGSQFPTDDLDICCRMIPENLSRLIEAVEGINPVFRDPRRIPLPTDPHRLSTFNHMLLRTDLGDFDVLNEIAGIGRYQEAMARSVERSIAGATFRVLDLDALIESKTAAGRDKDKLGVMHLLAVKKRLRDQPELF